MAENFKEIKTDSLEAEALRIELRKELIAECWRRGDLRYKFKKCQLAMHQALEQSNRIKYLIKCARRLGKSYWLLSEANSVGRTKSNAVIRYAAPTQKQVKQIIHPLMKKITEDCPEEIRPFWRQSEGCYFFPETEAHMFVAGVNMGHSDDHRGTACDLFIIDEAGTVDDLHYLVHDVALPQFLDPDGKVVGGRRCLIASSPARSPAHEFTIMAQEAAAEGYLSFYDIFSGEYPIDVLRMFLKEDGVPDEDISALLSGNYTAIKSTTVRREYLAQDIVDENYALCPEWRDSCSYEFELDEYFKFYHKYEALDVGIRDLTVGIFAHYDFRLGKVFIHDETVMGGPEMNTQKLADAIRGKEHEHFGVPGEKFQNYKVRKRVSDKDLLLIQDLSQLHNLYFEPTDKGGLEQMVNEVRLWAQNDRIVVHPRCKHVLGCLRYGVWNDAKTDFDRSRIYGHFDAFAALMYLLRNIDTKSNPIPKGFMKSEGDYFFTDEYSQPKSKLRSLFGLR